MSGEKCNNWLNGWARVVLMLVVAAVASVVFMWTSQAKQDEKINENTQAHAVLQERLKSIDEKLSEIKTLVEKKRR